MSAWRDWAYDTAERAARTFVGVALSAWLASGADLWRSVTREAAAAKLGFAVLSGMVTVAISVMAKFSDGGNTASFRKRHG